MIAYVLAFVVFWLLARMARDAAAEAPVPTAAPAPSPAMFDIRDGARLVRTPIADILAVRSAGNYAEFLLADDRRQAPAQALAFVPSDRDDAEVCHGGEFGRG